MQSRQDVRIKWYKISFNTDLQEQNVAEESVEHVHVTTRMIQKLLACQEDIVLKEDAPSVAATTKTTKKVGKNSMKS